MTPMTPGELWWDLRKGTTILHVEWGSARGKVFATECRMRKGPPVTIALSLDKNLRTRYTEVGTSVDARALADGGIANLALLQFFDEHVVSGLRSLLEHTEDTSVPWRLVVELRGQEHSFDVEPEFRDRHTLLLRVSESNDKTGGSVKAKRGARKTAGRARNLGGAKRKQRGR